MNRTNKVNNIPDASLIVIGGLTGSGKTTVADALAKKMTQHGQKTLVIDSDRIRKTLLNVSETTRLPQNAYTWEITERVISESQKQIKAAIKKGFNVLQCAMLSTFQTRQNQEDFAQKHSIPFTGIFIECDPEILKQRITHRKKQNDNASDAGLDVLKKVLPNYEKPTNWVIVNGNQTLEKVIKDTENILKIFPLHNH